MMVGQSQRSVAGTIFGIMAGGQLARFLTGVEIRVAGQLVPLWASALVTLIAGGLCVWLWRLSGCCVKKPPSFPNP